MAQTCQLVDVRRDSSASAILKVHALLGTPLAIADNQILDSPALLDCFANKSFRDLVHEDYEWLQLRLRQRESESQLDCFRRALSLPSSQGWKSSAFQHGSKNETLQRELSQVFSSADSWSALSDRGALRNRMVECARRINTSPSPKHEAMVNAVCHFAEMHAMVEIRQPPSAAPQGVTFGDVLFQLTKRADFPPQLAKWFVDREQGRAGPIWRESVDSELRPLVMRSHLLRFLPKERGSWGPSEVERWSLTVSCWGNALQQSLGCIGGVWEPFPLAVNAYRGTDSVPEAAVLSISERVAQDLSRRLDRGTIAWSLPIPTIRSSSWDTIAAVALEESVVRVRAAHRQALLTMAVQDDIDTKRQVIEEVRRVWIDRAISSNEGSPVLLVLASTAVAGGAVLGALSAGPVGAIAGVLAGLIGEKNVESLGSEVFHEILTAGICETSLAGGGGEVTISNEKR